MKTLNKKDLEKEIKNLDKKIKDPNSMELVKSYFMGYRDALVKIVVLMGE